MMGAITAAFALVSVADMQNTITTTSRADMSPFDLIFILIYLQI
jgi:hypothetical protein